MKVFINRLVASVSIAVFLVFALAQTVFALTWAAYGDDLSVATGANEFILIKEEAG